MRKKRKRKMRQKTATVRKGSCLEVASGTREKASKQGTYSRLSQRSGTPALRLDGAGGLLLLLLPVTCRLAL